MAENNPSNAAKSADAGQTNFGYRDVSFVEKEQLVHGVFDSVAPRYDAMNDLMSLGLHRLWKTALIDQLRPRPGMHLLDVAGGTGDIASRFLEAARRRDDRAQGQKAAHVTVCDINDHMLQVGRDRAIDKGRLGGIDWVCADAESLPLGDKSVDAYTVAFGIRNVADRDAALREAHRVLKPGAPFLCLEFVPADLGPLQPLYDFYSFRVVPKLGKAVADDEPAYRYLVESIRQFPQPEKFSDMIEDAGFINTKVRLLAGGIVALFSGWRI